MPQNRGYVHTELSCPCWQGVTNLAHDLRNYQEIKEGSNKITFPIGTRRTPARVYWEKATSTIRTKSFDEYREGIFLIAGTNRATWGSLGKLKGTASENYSQCGKNSSTFGWKKTVKDRNQIKSWKTCSTKMKQNGDRSFHLLLRHSIVCRTLFSTSEIWNFLQDCWKL